MKKGPKLQNNDKLCPKCLIDSYFFIGGGSWSPDICPECGHVETYRSLISYKSLSWWSKRKAQEKFKNMWRDIHK